MSGGWAGARFVYALSLDRMSDSTRMVLEGAGFQIVFRTKRGERDSEEECMQVRRIFSGTLERSA